MRDVRVIPSLHGITRDAWNACFAQELEDYDYLRAVEMSGMPNFTWRYVVVYADGVLCAAMPAFLTDYAIDTTLDGTGKKIAGMLRHLVPGLLTLKLACVGSPVTEYGLAGFHPSVPMHEKASLLGAMAAAFEAHAFAQGYRLIGLKDIPRFQQALWAPTFAQQGYRSIAGLPSANLATGFASMEDYFATLSAATRKDMRRKWRAAGALRVETRSEMDDVMPQIMALYRETRARADMQFEDLTEDFFRNVLRNVPGAFCTLYYAGDSLLAFNLLLRNETTLLDKFFCMEGVRGREYNLYFVSWLTNVHYCITHGLTQYQSGQAGYENKLRLGSTLTRTAMVFKHKNRLIHSALRLGAPLLAADDGKQAA